MPPLSPAAATDFLPDQQTYSSVSQAEDLEHYRPGGFHPTAVHTPITPRYKTLYKLGFGSFSTVWIARDKQHSTTPLVALKIGFHGTSAGNETHIIQQLRQKREDERCYLPGARYVLDIKESLEIEGPNGTHPVLVSEILGPSIRDAREEMDSAFPLRLRKRFAKQTAQGLAFIHSADITHGDLHPGNLLLYHPCFETWTEANVQQQLGKQDRFPIKRHDGRDPMPWAPEYQVGVDCARVLEAMGIAEGGEGEGAEIRIADFGESYKGRAERAPGIPVSYAAPEVLGMEGGGGEVRLEADVWSWGVTVYEMLTGCLMFPGCGADGGKVMESIERALENGGAGIEERLRRLDSFGEAEQVKAVFRGVFRMRPDERLKAREVVDMLPATW